MTDYTLSVALKADNQVSKAFRDAQNVIRQYGKNIQTDARRWTSSFQAAQYSITRNLVATEIRVRKNAQAFTDAGQGVAVFGAAVVTGLGFAAKAAIEWESAWAGVTKTTDAAAEDLPRLEASIRGLTQVLPASHQEIAAVAEAAGQLGIASTDVVQFTEVMVAMGVSTNLSSDDAATSIAQMMNIMQTAPENVGRLAATIVGLGNSGASTEQQIVEMSLRIAGAGHQIGLTEAEVLSFANAMASAGVRTELGGSAISRVFMLMSNAVNDGGAKLQSFAEIAGMSAEEFTQAFQNTPAKAVDSFIVGLGRISESGGDVFGTLDNVGMKSVEIRDVVLRLAGAGSLLTDSLATGNEAWAKNTALMDEARKRYETTASKIQIAQNQLNEVGIEIGSVLLPILADGAEGVADFAASFAALPDPVKGAVATLGSLVGVAGLVGGAILLLLPKIVEFRDAWKQVAPVLDASGKAGARLRAIFAGAGFAAGMLALVVVLDKLTDSNNKTAAGLEKTRNAMQSMEDTGALFRGLGGDYDSMRGALDLLTGDDFNARMERFGSSLNKVTGGMVSDQVQDARDQFQQMGQVLAEVAAVDLQSAQQQFAGWVEQAGGGEKATRALLDTMPEYEEALYNVASAQGMTLDETTLLAAATGELKIATQSAEQAAAAQAASVEKAAAAVGLSVEEYESAIEAAQKFRMSMDEASNSFVDISGTWTSLYDEQAQKAMEAKGTEGQAWYDMVGDVKVSLDEYIGQLERQAEAQANWQSNLLSLTDNLSRSTIQYLQSLGPEGASLVAELTDASTKELKKFDSLTQQTMEGASMGWVLDMERGMALVQAVLAEEGPKAASALADSLAAGETTVDQAAKRLGAKIQEGVPGEWVVQFDANTAPAEEKVRQFDQVATASTATVQIEGDDSGAREELKNVRAAIDRSEGTVTIYGEDGRALTTLSNFKRTVDRSKGTVTIEGEDRTGRSQVITFTNWADSQNASIKVDADTSAAMAAVARLRAAANVRARVDDGRNRSGFATGGWTGPGSKWEPVGVVHADEFVLQKEARRSIEGAFPGLLNALNAQGAKAFALGGYARGGAVQTTGAELERARRELDRAREQARDAREQERRAKSDRAQAAAEKAVSAAERRLDAAEQRMATARDRRNTAIHESRELRTDLRRGNIRESVSGGLSSAYGVVDRMRDLARDPALSDKAEKRLEKSAAFAEKRLRNMYRTSAQIENALAKARDRVQELSQIKGGVVSTLSGEQNIGGLLGKTNEFGFDVPVTASSIVSDAQARVARIREFALKMRQLQKLGYSGVIMQEIAQLGSEQGVAVADALIAGGKPTATSLNQAYKDIDAWSGRAGQVVTEGFYKGGLSAADGLVEGLERREKNIQAAMIRLAKSMEKALKKALGIRSPARKPMQWMEPVGDGFVIGIDNQQAKVEKAMNRLVVAPTGGFSNLGASGAAGVGIAGLPEQDRALLTQTMQEMRALADRPVVLSVNRRQVGTLYREGAAASKGLA